MALACMRTRVCTHEGVRLIEVVTVKMLPWRQVEEVGEFSGGWRKEQWEERDEIGGWREGAWACWGGGHFSSPSKLKGSDTWAWTHGMIHPKVIFVYPSLSRLPAFDRSSAGCSSSKWIFFILQVLFIHTMPLDNSLFLFYWFVSSLSLSSCDLSTFPSTPTSISEVTVWLSLIQTDAGLTPNSAHCSPGEAHTSPGTAPVHVLVFGLDSVCVCIKVGCSCCPLSLVWGPTGASVDGGAAVCRQRDGAAARHASATTGRLKYKSQNTNLLHLFKGKEKC